MTEKEPAPKVSVIVPVYNVEPYLRECLDSIVGQTLPDIEILCIDDGSTDGSPAILREYAARDARVRILTQENRGVSAARNRGLTAARGEYVIFWDSDDWFERDALALLYSIAAERGADLVICNAQDFDHATGTDLAHNYLRKPYPETEVFCAADCPDRIFDISGMNGGNRLVRRSLLTENGIAFPESDITEDAVVAMLELMYARRIALCPRRLPHFRFNRAGSLMTDYSRRADAMIEGCRECQRQLSDRGFLTDERFRRAFLDKVAGLYFYTLPLFGDYAQFAAYYHKMFLSEDSLLRQWDTSWEPLPYIREYLQAAAQTPEEYLFGQFRIMTRLDKERRTRIRELEKQNKILEHDARPMRKLRESAPYQAAKNVKNLLKGKK